MPSPEMLRRRAELFARARAFFAARDVLEVETPVLGRGVVVEAHIDPIPCAGDRHLLTSPEGPMKRLLAAGSGPIFQFAHAFRDGESGRRHSREFTMLEWYRPGFDHHALMTEVEAFVSDLLPDLGAASLPRRSYRDVFREGVGIDPFATDLPELRGVCVRHGVPVPESFASGSIDDALDLVLVGCLEHKIHGFVHDYPASQAALAQVREDRDGNAVAERFELYVHGVELANGYHELADSVEQRRRFEAANRDRAARGASQLPIDEPLLQALRDMPACAGVALGFDRLVMVATGAADIRDVRMLSD